MLLLFEACLLALEISESAGVRFLDFANEDDEDEDDKDEDNDLEEIDLIALSPFDLSRDFSSPTEALPFEADDDDEDEDEIGV